MPPGMMPPMLPSTPPTATQLKPGPNVTIPATLKVSGVAAIVNGEKITNDQLVRRFLQNGGQPTLQELITETEVDQAARKSHVVVTAAEVNDLLQKTKIQLLERSPNQTWTQFLESHGLSEAYARDQMRMELTVEKIAVAKQPAYTLKGKIHIYHILIATTSLPYAKASHSDEDAQAQIKSIREQIESGKITFLAAAKKYSEDSSNASKGGDLGWVSETDPLDATFKQAAFALKQGQISDPVKSQFGWHLIYLAKMGSNAGAAEVLKAADESLDARSRPYVGQIIQDIQANSVVDDILIPIPPKASMPTRMMQGHGSLPLAMHGPAGPVKRGAAGKTPPPPPL